MTHPATGPITPEEMQRIASLPYGKAQAELRKHDPAWGLATPESPLIKWDVMLVGSVPAYATVEVEAPDEETARKMALAMRLTPSDWDVDNAGQIDDIDVDEVTPA